MGYMYRRKLKALPIVSNDRNTLNNIIATFQVMEPDGVVDARNVALLTKYLEGDGFPDKSFYGLWTTPLGSLHEADTFIERDKTKDKGPVDRKIAKWVRLLSVLVPFPVRQFRVFPEV